MAVELEREEFMQDEVFYKLYKAIKNSHKVANHTIKTLMDNRDVENFCERACHYINTEGPNPIWIKYEVETWLKQLEDGFVSFPVSIKKIYVFDDFLEFETDRAKALHGTANEKGNLSADIPNIN